MSIPPIVPAADIAEVWRSYGGDTPWTAALDEFGALGGLVQYWSGMPRCASAIPLTFALFSPDGEKLQCSYRLKDIIAATRLIRDAKETLEAVERGDDIS